MNENSKCCTCGYVWPTGTDRRHSCASELRDLLIRIRNEPELIKRPRAGAQDQYAGMPAVYRLIDSKLSLPWAG